MGATQSKTSPYVLETKRGKLKGVVQKDLNSNAVLYRYTKIPYAHPPTGSLRWRRPQPLPRDWSFSTSSSEPGDYTEFGPICPQPLYNHGAAQYDDPNNAAAIENAQSEDCLYLNVWVPAGTPPADGWPVQFHIHGGWLQVGNANQSNDHDPFDLLAHSTQRIIVVPTYRLNLFGFLAGQELKDAEKGDPVPANYGLWDQRAALEWVHGNIHLFGGNSNLVSVGGLSAGAHSAFLQLYYDTYLPQEKRLIKQVYLWSNAMAIQPNATTSQTLTNQWQELCDVTGAGKAGDDPSQKLEALRNVPAEKLVEAISKLKMHTFRTSTDNDFLSSDFLQSLHDGSFSALLAEHGVRLILGEVSDEALLYKLVNPPSNREDMLVQMGNYYPKHVVDRLMTLTNVYDIPDEHKEDANSEQVKERYRDVFARIVADMQVHASERGLTKCLVAPPDGAAQVPEVMRYRIAWRAKALDKHINPEVGVCHAGDTPIWWMSGFRAGFDEEDKEKTLEFLKPFGEFLEGKPWVSGVGKGEDGAKKIGRYLDERGVTHEVVDDKLWEKGMQVWSSVAGVQGLKATPSRL